VEIPVKDLHEDDLNDLEGDDEDSDEKKKA
jgi:hypothetical protein